MKVGDIVIIDTKIEGGRYARYNGEEVTVISIIKHKGETVVTCHNPYIGYVTMKETGFREIPEPMTLTQFIQQKSFLVKNDNNLPPGGELLPVVPVHQLKHYFPQLVDNYVKS